MARVYERDTDAIFLRYLRQDPRFARNFLKLAGDYSDAQVVRVRAQTRHIGPGTIDLEVHCRCGPRLLIENKIDAAYSVTGFGSGQPERYRATVRAYRESGEAAASVLIAPQHYLVGSPSAMLFDHHVAYEQMIPLLAEEDRATINAAIEQSKQPYEPINNLLTGDFFRNYRRLVADRFPDLVMHEDPNANGIRPSGSRTIYFDTSKTLILYPDLPRPRMSLQCWDSAQRSPSAKIMIGSWGRFCRDAIPQESFQDIGAYLRPAGRSLARTFFLLLSTHRCNALIYHKYLTPARWPMCP